MPAADHIYHLLKAAEAAWTTKIPDAATARMDHGGSVTFPILGQGNLSVGANGLVWNQSQSTLVLKRPDIESFSRNLVEFSIQPSFIGASKGFEGLKSKTEAIGNLEALQQIMIHVLGVPHLTT